MRSPNWFWSSDRFLTFASWQDRAGSFALWPSLMVETQVDLGADVQSTRWTLVLGRRRWQLDVARYTPRATAGKIDWSAGPGGIEEMLRWSKKVFRRSWTKADIEKLFVKRPEWRRLVIQSGARHHYIRVLLARELMDQEAGAGPIEPLPRAAAAAADQLAAALRMPKADEKAESEWSNASLDARRRPFRSLGTVEGQDPMEQLDHLANLLDLPQEVRDLGEADLPLGEDLPLQPSRQAQESHAPVTDRMAPATMAAPTKPSALPSYLPPSSQDESDAARLLEASLNDTDDASPQDPLMQALAQSLASADSTTTPAPARATEPALPSFLPPPMPADEKNRALTEALQRALSEPSDPHGEASDPSKRHD